ncbi:syntaxin-43-like protein [Tanacetum coccineum]
MATRNGTFMFKRYRDALKTVWLPSYTADASGGGPVIEMTGIKQTRSYAPLSTIDPGTSSSMGTPTLTKAHAKALMPSSGDGKEDQHMIKALTYEVTDLLKKSEKKLRKLSAGGPLEDSTIRKNVQRSLATDLQSFSGTPKEAIALSEVPSAAAEREFRCKHQMAKLKKSEAFTMEREREIQQVGESVNELAQIMKDLSVLVIDQGTIIDRIDYNIQNVAATVDEGLKQLQKVAIYSMLPSTFY